MKSLGERQAALIEKLKTHRKTKVNRAQQRVLAALIEPIPAEKVFADLNAAAEVLYDSSPEKPEKGLRVYCAEGSLIPDVLTVKLVAHSPVMESQSPFSLSMSLT